MILLSNINLDGISFNNLGRGVEFSFIDMDKGEPLTNLQCNAVYLFNYHNSFSDDEGFACYIAEVTYEFIPADLASKILMKYNFSFINLDGSTLVPTKKDLINLHIESGDIVVDIICEEIFQDGKKLELKKLK